MELLALAVKVISIGAVAVPLIALAVLLGVTWLMKRRKKSR